MINLREQIIRDRGTLVKWHIKLLGRNAANTMPWCSTFLYYQDSRKVLTSEGWCQSKYEYDISERTAF